MMYLWPQTGSMRSMRHRFGVITTAAHRCVPTGIKEGRLWALDNECFRRPFDYQRWLAHWHRLFPYSKRCLFVVVPDKPSDVRATLALWHDWHALIRKQLDRFDNCKRSGAHMRKPWLGLAFAAQDGQESLPLPEEADWVFIAGSTEWKLSDAAASVIQWAWDASMYIHVGRVNSQRRYRHFRRLADRLDLDIVSCDGTAARFHPAQALRRLTDVIEETFPRPACAGWRAGRARQTKPWANGGPLPAAGVPCRAGHGHGVRVVVVSAALHYTAVK